MKSEFDKSYFGVETSIDLKKCNPELIRDEKAIKLFVISLCEILNVKRYGETTVVNFGEDPKVSGFSMVQLIETSLISAHFVNQTNAIYLNIFSCKEFDPMVAANFAKDFFKAEDMELIVNYRNI